MHEPGPVLISRSFFLDEEAATAAVVICHQQGPRVLSTAATSALAIWPSLVFWFSSSSTAHASTEPAWPFPLRKEAATAAVVICRISHRRRPRSPVRARNKTRTDKTEPTPRDRDTSRDQTPGRFQEDDRRFWGFAVFLVSVYLAVFLVSVYTTARKKTSRSRELPAVRADRQSPRWPVAVREQPAIGPPGVVLCFRPCRALHARSCPLSCARHSLPVGLCM